MIRTTRKGIPAKETGEVIIEERPAEISTGEKDPCNTTNNAIINLIEVQPF
jgi:hypothetical protein